MTIKIRNGKFRIRLFCPIFLLGIALKRIGKHSGDKDGAEIKLTKQNIKDIKKSLADAKKRFGHLELLRAESDDGATVIIKL